jgi:hypothetical protein
MEWVPHFWPILPEVGILLRRENISLKFCFVFETLKLLNLPSNFSRASRAQHNVLPPESKTGSAPGSSYAGNSKESPPEIQARLPIGVGVAVSLAVRNAAVSFNRGSEFLP